MSNLFQTLKSLVISSRGGKTVIADWMFPKGNTQISSQKSKNWNVTYFSARPECRVTGRKISLLLCKGFGLVYRDESKTKYNLSDGFIVPFFFHCQFNSFSKGKNYYLYLLHNLSVRRSLQTFLLLFLHFVCQRPENTRQRLIFFSAKCQGLFQSWW